MELRVLRYFLAVANEENITRAAEVLHITQPTLSRQLMKLEEELDTQLFIRGNSKIVLTKDGMLLKRRAQEMIDMANKTKKEFLQKDDSIDGEIFIGAGETPLMEFLANFIKEFNQVNPRVTYRLFSGNADDIKEKIDNGLIDIGLLNEPVDIGKYDFIRLPEKDTWGILMLKDDILSKKEYIQSSDLISKSIICSHRETVQNELSNWFGSSFNNVDILITYNLIYNASLMVRAGLGYAITIDKIIDSNDDNQLCFRPFYPPLETGCVLVWKKNQIFSPAASEFIRQLKNKFKGDN